MSMTKQSVDALVQAAVSNLRAGRAVEDDAGLELKERWPDPTTRARQLAAAANALGGEALVYAIGVNDKNGDVTTPERREVQDWCAQLAKQFDQIAPELLWSQTVYVGDDADSIQVLVFDTSDFPYVVKAPENRFEVPYRRGTATRSARRSDLVRMLSSRTRVPPIAIAEAKVWFRAFDDANSGIRITGAIEADIFIEQAIGEVATLPIRDMRARIAVNDVHIPADVEVRQLGERWSIRRRGEPYPPEPIPPALGVYARDGFVVATAPGEFQVSSRVTLPSADAPEALKQPQTILEMKDILGAADEMRADLALRVVGAERLVRVSASLVRVDEGNSSKVALGTWEYAVVAVDPWTEDDQP
ncbi:hypothetical protein ACIA03_21485 [Nocardioides sp. NPDC051685]|uniref:hypothetical protein n=1 Tax=Nocardioides sp. NPDC051685 TaxID=3364334 RepID=UPI00379055D6